MPAAPAVAKGADGPASLSPRAAECGRPPENRLPGSVHRRFRGSWGVPTSYRGWVLQPPSQPSSELVPAQTPRALRVGGRLVLGPRRKRSTSRSEGALKRHTRAPLERRPSPDSQPPTSTPQQQLAAQRRPTRMEPCPSSVLGVPLAGASALPDPAVRQRACKGDARVVKPAGSTLGSPHPSVPTLSSRDHVPSLPYGSSSSSRSSSRTEPRKAVSPVVGSLTSTATPRETLHSQRC